MLIELIFEANFSGSLFERLLISTMQIGRRRMALIFGQQIIEI